MKEVQINIQFNQLIRFIENIIQTDSNFASMIKEVQKKEIEEKRKNDLAEVSSQKSLRQNSISRPPRLDFLKKDIMNIVNKPKQLSFSVLNRSSSMAFGESILEASRSTSKVQAQPNVNLNVSMLKNMQSGLNR